MEQAALGSIPAASTTVVGKSRFATNAETATGTSTTIGVTPSGIANMLATNSQKGVIRTASGTDITTGTATDVAVTPSNLGVVTSSMSANGYARLPGGLIVQWGSATVSNSNTTVTLPLTFPNNCFSAVTATRAVSNTIGVVSVSTSSIVLIAGSAGTSAYWIAVGN